MCLKHEGRGRDDSVGYVQAKNEYVYYRYDVCAGGRAKEKIIKKMIGKKNTFKKKTLSFFNISSHNLFAKFAAVWHREVYPSGKKVRQNLEGDWVKLPTVTFKQTNQVCLFVCLASLPIDVTYNIC